MPVTPTYPGVYIEEIPSGVRTIVGVATSICAFIGFTPRGPVNQAVRVLNFGDYERAFGGLDRNSEVSYAVQQFFMNGGTDAYVVRVAKNSAPSQVTLRDMAGANVLVVTAATPGVWGNNLRVEIDFATTNPDSTFNLTVRQYGLQQGALIETDSEKFLNLGMNSRASNYVVNVMNASSKLVKLTRPPALTFTERGISWSASLATFPTLTAQDSILNGMLDGIDPFTLVVSNPAAVTNMTQLVTALNSAISAAGLSSRLQANRANALGATDGTGNFIKMTSKLDGTNPNTVEEFSSVQITPASANDLAVKLGLGLPNGGRERVGAFHRRPVPNGTVSADLADTPNVGAGNLDITINDNSSGTVAIDSATNVAVLTTAVGPALAMAIETAIRSIANPAAQQATVQYIGKSLRALPSAATPNASIVFANAIATSAKLTGAGSFVNVQQYALGGGATFGAQNNAQSGVDGTQPDGATIIGNFNNKTGIYALRDVDLFNLMCIPLTPQLSDSEAKAVLSAAITFCEQERAFFIVDPDSTKNYTDIAAWAAQVSTSRNAAIYFPRLQVADPLDDFRVRQMPASGAIAGVYARTDSTRGVWKAPAGTDATIRGAQGLSVVVTDQENGTINPKGVNALRTFPVYNTIVWGARTMRGDDQQADEYKYVPVRRLALFIEETLYRNTQWVVFEPNDEPLWAQIRLNIGAFMHDLFVQGAFQGKTPREAYFVKCDRETTTQNDINRGVVNIVVGFAPLKPAEFVIIKLQQMAGQIQV